jgi:hypothetical protein
VQRLDLRNTEHAHGIAEQGLAFQGAREQRSREPLARSSRLSQVEIAATSSFDGAQAIHLGIECFEEGVLAKMARISQPANDDQRADLESPCQSTNFGFQRNILLVFTTKDRERNQ